jgi:D-lactate dehydrogenase (cytochrome)
VNKPIDHARALHQPVPAQLHELLADFFGARYSVAQAVRDHHGRDESPYVLSAPQAVVFAESVEDVVALVKFCAQFKYPVIPYGAGSSLEGHFLAVQGGVCLDVSRMNTVLSINAEDLTATVQPGVTRKQLNNELKGTGLFFPIDPGADASLGGMSSTRASGTNAVRYGTMKENVLSLTVVTAAGKIIRTAQRAKKSSAGYDLTRLFVGSEGTLGVIVEVTVKLYPQPEALAAAICNFTSTEQAINAVIQTIQMGVPVARCEFLCAQAIRAINAHSHTTMKQQPTLLFEFHGSDTSVKEQAQLVESITSEFGGEDFEWATKPEDRSRLWNARHNFYFAGLQLRPGSRAISTDTCVPISKLAQSLVGAQVILKSWPHPCPIVGHVGDGNFHAMILLNPDDPAEVAAAEKLNEQIIRLALKMEGTCTGEHGVGVHKIGYLVEELGEDAVDLMRGVKHTFDPDNIMNPGKIFRFEAPAS